MRHLQKGFSLVELMVASTIGLIVVGSIGYFYIGTRQAYRTTDNLSRIQENQRIALDTLAREIRQAGYVGCLNLAAQAPRVIANPPPGSTSPYVVDAGTMAQIFNNVTDWTDVTGGTPPTIALVPATDVLSLRYASNGSIPAKLTGNLPPQNTNIQLTGNPANFNANDVLIISDCIKTDIFRATNVGNGGGVTVIAYGNNANTNINLRPYDQGAEVLAFHDVTFFIGTNPAGNPALYRFDATDVNAVGAAVAEEIAENVENMQLEYGLDTNAADKVSRVDTYSPTLIAGATIVSIRVALVFSGAGVGVDSADKGLNTATAAQSYSLLGTTYIAPDSRLRKVGTATVLLRNQGAF